MLLSMVVVKCPGMVFVDRPLMVVVETVEPFDMAGDFKHHVLFRMHFVNHAMSSVSPSSFWCHVATTLLATAHCCTKHEQDGATVNTMEMLHVHRKCTTSLLEQ